jgi:hypothetical protein
MYKKHDQRYFAMLNNAVAIGDTPLEGGNDGYAFEYYYHLLTRDYPADCPSDHLTPKEEAAVKKSITDLISFNALMQKNFGQQFPTGEDLQKALTEFVDLIKVNTEDAEACYLPSGWTAEPGHYASLKCRKLPNGHFVFSLLNQGGGMEYHQEAPSTGTKDRRIYQSDEYEVDLNDKNGRELIQRLIELKTLTTMENTYDSGVRSDIRTWNEYSQGDLYGLLKLYGKELPLTDKLDQKAVTPQRGGSCTMTNTNLAPRDVLVNLGADLKKRKRYSFVLKLHSMLDGFEAYQQGDMDRNVLEWGLREFSVRVNKEFKHILTPDEVIYCGQLEKTIEERLAKDKESEIRQKSAAEPWPNPTGEAPANQAIVIEKKEKKENEDDKENELPKEKLGITPENIKEILARVEEVWSDRIGHQYHLLQSLPHCSGKEEDPFWDKVPREDITPILVSLLAICGSLNNNFEAYEPLEKQRALVIALTMHDIAAQLNGDKAFSFGLDDIYSDLKIFTDPEVYFTVKRIVKNFENRAAGKRRVLTNRVGMQGSAQDDTVNYLINVVLDMGQRAELMQALQLKECTDHKFFEEIMKSLGDDEVKKILGVRFLALVEIAGSAHAKGAEIKRYSKEGTSGNYHFSTDQYYKELKRKKELERENSDVGKHLPNLASGEKQEHFKDYSENTVYHPQNDLIEQREGKRYLYKSDISPDPYSVDLTGSLNPDSEAWDPKEEIKELADTLYAQFQKLVDSEVSRDEMKEGLKDLIKQPTRKAYQNISQGIILLLNKVKEDKKQSLEECKTSLKKLSDTLDGMESTKRFFNEMNEEFRMIECSPHLQVERTLAWIQKNPEKLRFKSVRKRATELLFTYGCLDSAFANDTPLIVKQINACMSALIKNCQEESIEDPKILSWIGGLFNDLRQYAEVTAKLYGIQLGQTPMSSLTDHFTALLQKITNEKTRGLLAAELVKGYRNKSPLTVEDCARLLTLRLIVELGDSTPLSTEIWKSLSNDVIDVIKSNIDEFNRLINPLLVKYLKQPQGLCWSLQEGELINDKTDFFIDLNHGSLEKRGVFNLRDVTHRIIKDNPVLCTRLLITSDNPLYYQSTLKKDSKAESRDGRWILSVNYGNESIKIYDVDQRISIEGMNYVYRFLNAKQRFIKSLSPFESEDSFDTFYQYWQCQEDENVYFVRQENSDLAYYYSADSKLILQLKENSQGIWERTGKVLLNLSSPTTALEKAWAERLGPLFGVSNIRCTASLMNNSQYQLERIEHLTLGMNFSPDKDNHWCLESDPDYYLAEEKSLEILEGLPSVILLKNKKNEMRILVPGFSLSQSDKDHPNNAFNQTKLIDYTRFCDDSCRSFEYTLDEHQGLVGKTVESNLYLAQLYRSMGNYRLAFHYLERAKTSQPLSSASLAIILQSIKHQIKSPLGAAFDLKLNAYMNEQQEKWGRRNKPLDIPGEWGEWIVETQVPLYKATISQYKAGVSILPSYGRLISDEIEVVSNIKPPHTALSDKLTPEKRLIKVSSLDRLIFERKDKKSWEVFSGEIQGVYARHFKYESHDNGTWRFFDKRFKFGPGFSYLFNNFSSLLREAISKDPARLDDLRKKLFALLMNDPDPVEQLYPLVALLAFATEYPDYFTGFSFPVFPEKVGDYDYEGQETVRNLKGKVIEEAGNVFLAHKSELMNKEVHLIEFDRRINQVQAPIPLPADFKLTPVHFALDQVKLENTGKHPLKAIADHYLSKVEATVAEGHFGLEFNGMQEPSALERRLYDHYKEGHQENLKKTRPRYQVKDPFTLAEIQAALKEQQAEDKKQLKHSKDSLMLRANRTPLDKPNRSKDEAAEAYNALLSRASEQHGIITISDLFTAFLQQKPALLTEKNPYLTQEDIGPLFAQLADYALMSSRIAQVTKAFEDVAGKNAVSDLQPYELQLFAETIDKKRTYDIAEYPEFLVYEYATKRILREDQVKILIKIITLLEADSFDDKQLHHALLQFAAGGGKTAVLIPILAQRFARKGFLPVIFNTNELYETGLEDIPKNLRASLMQNMEVVERELEHTWSEPELKKLLKDLERWRSEEKCLLLKPVTWHSLNIARKLAYFKGHDALAQAAENVLDFFKFKTIKLEDESHIISDPLQQSIKTYNKPLKLPEEQLNLMLRLYDRLMGYEPGSGDIERLAGIKAKRKDPITPANLVLLKKKLAESIVKDACFKSCDKDELIDYLTKTTRERPAWLVELHERDATTADLVVLARAFIQSHLPHILTLQAEKDYGTSIHEGDLTAAPKHEGKGVTSHFGDHTLVVALTIQMMEQNGLNSSQVEQLLDSLVEFHRKERIWNVSLAIPTKAELWLRKFNSLGYTIKTIRDLTPDLRSRLRTDPRFTQHPEVVKKFLVDFALPQVEIPPERQSSTPAEMQAGFSRSLLLSATPGLPEIYPAVLPKAACFLEQAFEAEVIDTLLSPKNSQHCLLKASQTPTEFFESLSPEFLASITTLIDRGALLTDFSGEEVVNAYLNLKADRPRPTTTGVFFTKEETVLNLEGKQRIHIPGTALVETLKKKGIKPEQFLLFLFMDLSKTTGIDIKRPFHDVAGLTVGKEQTVTETIQAAMRERQLLEKNAQTVKWIMFESLYHEINPTLNKNEFDPRHLVYWMIKNEATQLKTRLTNRAYQGLEHEIQALVWAWWREDPQKFPAEFKTKLKQLQSISPWDIYEQPSADLPAAVVLEGFKETLFNRFGFTEDDPRVPAPVRARIQKIIEETAALIEALPSPPKIQMNNEIQQEMLIETLHKEEQEIQQTLKKNIDSATEFVFAVETLEGNSVDAFFPEDLKPIILPGCETIQSKAPPLLFKEAHFRVLASLNPREIPKFDQLKPIEMLLIEVKPDGSKRVRACTAIEADYYSLILKKSSLSNENSSYFIISSDGSLFSRSNNAALPTCEQWIQGADLQTMLTYAQFLSGNIKDPIKMSQFIKALGWSKTDYETLANTLMPMLVSTKVPYLINNAALYNLCGWQEESSQAVDYVEPSAQPAFTLPLEALHVATRLEKDPGELAPDPLEPKRALENYLFTTPIKKPEVVYKEPKVIAKVRAPARNIEAGSTSGVDPMAAVKERYAHLEGELEEIKNRYGPNAFNLKIQAINVGSELRKTEHDISQIYITENDALAAAKKASDFMDNWIKTQLIPYKFAVHESLIACEKQRPAYEKLALRFNMLKTRILSENENISDEISELIKKGDKTILDSKNTFREDEDRVKFLCYDFENIIQTIESRYIPPVKPKEPSKKKWW